MLVLKLWVLCLLTNIQGYQIPLNFSEQERMLAQFFQGSWRLMNANKLGSLQFLHPKEHINEINSGTVLLDFYSEKGPLNKIIAGVSMLLLYPKYKDQYTVRLDVPIMKHSEVSAKMEWRGKSIGKFQIFFQGDRIQQGKANLNYVMTQNSLEIGASQQLILWLRFQRQGENIFTVWILMFVSLFLYYCFGQELVREEEIQLTQRHHPIPIVLSLGFLLMISGIQISIGFLSLFNILGQEVFLLIAGILNLVLFSAIFTRYQEVIFMLNEYVALYLITSIVYICILLFLRHNNLIFVLNSLILLPQILYHITRGQKVKADFHLLILFSINQSYVCYYKGYDNNIFGDSPTLWVVKWVLGSSLLQITMILGQIRYGSRCIIPQCLKKTPYNYYRQGTEQLCPICLHPVKGFAMVTPCNHEFHEDCLLGWMFIKMQCPVDRYNLPPI